MNRIKTIALGVFILALLACEQPFKAGLGPVVDIRDPTLTLTRPVAGSYIWGGVRFEGTAEDDYILSKVELKVTNRPDALDDAGKPYLQVYTVVPLNKTKQNHGNWSYVLKTKNDDGEYVFPEGDLKLRFKVTDSVGKFTETDEIVFNVKNDPPAISVSAPYIASGDDESDPGDVGGPHLNYYVDNDGNGTNPENRPEEISFPRKVDRGAYLTGAISDKQGIYTAGPEGKFPPQIRIWRVDNATDLSTTPHKTFKAGVLPTPEQVEWVPFQSSELIPLAGVGNYMFAYELPNDPGSFYGFEIRAHSIDENQTEFHFPRDYYPGFDFDKADGTDENENWFKKENRYVIIFIKAPESTPSVEFYALQDIFGELNNGSYNTIQDGGVDLNDNKAHPYVNSLTVSKNGPFTLRVKAIHQEGIESAELYWEGNNERGRFIWDLANDAPAGSTGWDMTNTVRATERYSYWGYVDRLEPDTEKNYVFTYKHDGNDRIPAGNNYNTHVQGRSKIQRFNGTDAAWEAGKKSFQWPNQSLDPDIWEDIAKLDEGEYRLEVYARSKSLTGMTVPSTRTVRLDWVMPELEITSVEGEYGPPDSVFGEFTSDGPRTPASVVNGVIQPRVRIADSRINDTNIRTGTHEYYDRGELGSAKEQRYLLVKKAGSDKLAEFIAGEDNWWPPLPASGGINGTLTLAEGITAEKHGLVLDGGFKIKTSSIYSRDDPDEEGVLADGDYWLYVFARDNAFNVNHLVRKIVVRWISDIPRFDFNVGSMIPNVKKPGYTDDKDPQGFFGTASSARNILGSGDIKIRIMDDDSLDLGVLGGDLSNITVEFSDSTLNPDGSLTENDLQKLDDAIVKLIFGSQSADRRPIKGQTGTISQAYLPGAVNGRLPDGIYRLKITIRDYQDSKLTMSDTKDAMIEEFSEEFWFAVNNAIPEFETKTVNVPGEGPVNTPILPPSGNAKIDDLQAGLTGNVSTVNGPITIKYTVTKGPILIDSGELPFNAAENSPKNPVRDPIVDTKLKGGRWEVDFTAPLNIPKGSEGTYVVTLTATDRFGKLKTEPMQYMIDEVGPEVTIRSRMQTVDRTNYENLDKNELGDLEDEELDCLANGIVSFTLRATDISGINELKWWLIKEPFTGWNHDTYPPDSEDGRSGSLLNSVTSNFNEAQFWVDTTGLEGFYSLYAMAEDKAGSPGNLSVVSTKGLQTIYIEKKSDLPFFGPIELANGKTVGSNGAVVTGIIYEDDGFMNNAGNPFYEGSIKIWMSANKDAATDEDDGIEDSGTYSGSDPSFLTNGYTGPVTIPITLNGQTQLSRMGARNMNLNINLAEQPEFRKIFYKTDEMTGSFIKDDDGNDIPFDGPKHYIIQATDSPYGKFDTDGKLTITERKFRRFYYNFNYDTLPPEINVTSPAQNATFKGTNVSFDLIGSMKDANLDKIGGNYYFRFKFNDQAGEGTLLELDTTEILGYPDSVKPDANNEVTVNFRILAYRVTNTILSSASLLEGFNTLWLTAYDESGKVADFGLKFFRDGTGPQIFLDENEVKLDGTGPNGQGWWPLKDEDNQTWYEKRKELLEGKNVPIIQRSSSGVASIEGSFEDESSNVGTGYSYWFDGDVSNPPVTIPQTGTPLPTDPNDSGSRSVRWKVSLPNTLADGLHSIRFEVADQHGNLNEESAMFAFKIISELPTVTLEPPVDAVLGDKKGQLLNDEVFKVTGEAGSSNLANVKVTIRNPLKGTSITGNLVTVSGATDNWPGTGAIENEDLKYEVSGTPLSKVTEKLVWKLQVTRSDLLKAGGIASPGASDALVEGVYELAVKSSDRYNTSEERVWQFTIDGTSPRISFSTLQPLPEDNVTPYSELMRGKTLQEKTLTMENPSIPARIEDSWSPLKTVQRQIRKYDYGFKYEIEGEARTEVKTTEGWTYFNFITNDWVYSPTAPTDIAFWETVTGNTGSPSWVLRETFPDTITEGVNQVPNPSKLTDGFYSLRYRAKDSAVIVSGSDASWDSTDGNGNPVISSYLYFFYSTKGPQINHDNAAQRTFTSRVSPHQVPLGIIANNENRFNTLAVAVKNAGGATLGITVPGQNGYAVTEKYDFWEPSVNIIIPPRFNADGSTNTSGYADGSYSIVFTLSDLAGRTEQATRTITLDNTAPSGTIDEPTEAGDKGVIKVYNADGTAQEGDTTLYKYASQIKIGGEALSINGTADDINDVKEVWFHLGYGYDNSSRTNNSLPGNANITAFPDETRVKGYFTNDTLGSVPVAGSAWVQYEAGEVPFPYFDAMPSAISHFKWSLQMTLEGIENYVKAIAINDTTYAVPTNGTGPWMVQLVDDQRIPAQYRRNGNDVYSLPLWVRIVDGVGNVSYIARDIWIYPNGDYPMTTITNPAGNTGTGAARGGMIVFEGTASDNVSVRKVIYRVRADNYTGTDYGYVGTNNIRELKGAKPLSGDTDRTEMERIFALTTNGGAALGTDWYVADLPRAGEQSAPWSFTINSEGEITELISTAGINNMIRVRVEMYVFDDTGLSTSFNKVSLGTNGAPGSAAPYVRVFYLTNSAPSISNYRISRINASLDTFDPYVLGDVRSGRFAIQASLSSGGATTNRIREIQVRLRDESVTAETNWMTVYTLAGGPLATGPAGMTLPAANVRDGTLTWQFDSVNDSPGFKRVRNEGWSRSGGRYTIDILVRDNIEPPSEAQYSFEIGIDNFAPFADPNNPMTRTPSKVAGTNAAFFGRVFDYTGTQTNLAPPYRGIDRVSAWFTYTLGGETRYINPATGVTGDAEQANANTVSAWTGRSAGTGQTDTIDSIPSSITEGSLTSTTIYPTNADYRKEISQQTSGTLTNQITWQPNGDHDIYWSFIADTTKMPSGPITMHYLVYDKAGNVSYYFQSMVVMNGYPQITNVTLRTNNIGVGAVFTTHEGDVAQESYSIPNPLITDGYLNSGFISKNQAIAFGVDTIGGNGALDYRVQYVERVKITLTKANLASMAANTYGTTSLYTIDSVGDVDDYSWGLLGVPVARPPAGTHFVFQASTATINQFENDFSGTVWGYRVVNQGATPIARTVRDGGNSVSVITGTPGNETAGPLSFIGSTTDTTLFGTTGIRENNAENYYFLIKVWDTVNGIRPGQPGYNEDDMLYDAVVVDMSVYLSDSTDPKARLYDLNPYTETEVVSYNADETARNNTRNNAADPTAIGENILRGGLYNVKTERDMLKSGYIDPRNGTTALNPEIQDPDTLQWRNARPTNFVTGDTNVNDAEGTPDVDKVSGKVILRGQVWDDQFVKEIRIKIGDDAVKPILQLTDIMEDGRVVRREMRAVGTQLAYAAEELHWKKGHTVEWAYVWDTELEPALPAASVGLPRVVTVTVSTIDRNGNSGAGRPNTSYSLAQETGSSHPNKTFHNTIPVSIVPYVVGFERQSQYTTTRSRQGWYSFFQGESDITVMGYNLGIESANPEAATTRPTVTISSSAAGTPVSMTVATTVNNVATRFPFPRRYTFTVPDATTSVSGRINVTTSNGTGTAAYNHDSIHENRSWNKEHNTYTAGSDLWINKPHVHIWRTNQSTNAPKTYFGGTTEAGTLQQQNHSQGSSSTGMALEYTGANAGRLHAVWTAFTDATYYYGTNAAGDGTRQAMQLAPAGDPFGETDISLYNGSGTANISAVYQNDGAPYVLLRTTMTVHSSNPTNNTYPGAANQEHRNARISAVVTATAGDPTGDNVRATERWRNTRIAKAAINAATNPIDPYTRPQDVPNDEYNPGGTNFRAGRVYMTAYDSQNKYLWFGMRYNSGTNNAYTNYTRIIDGRTATTQFDRTDHIGNPTGSINASTNQGEYSAVDYDGTGPIIAYYDQEDDTVRMAFGTLGAGDTASITSWSRRHLLPNTHPLFRGSGKYISMKVDKGGGIHLAFYNSTHQTVVYAYMESRTASATAYTVDNVIQGGFWTDISVDDYNNPMIVYGFTSRLGTYDGVRIAYKNSAGTVAQTGEKFDGALKCPVTGTSIAGWEALSMPASYIVKNDRLNVEVWPPTNRTQDGGAGGGTALGTAPGWNAAVGYASDRYRIGYFYYPTWKGY